MFCQNCGTENRDEAIFCENCGKELNQSAQVKMPKKTNQKRKYYWIFGGVITVFSCLCALYFIGSQPEDIYMEANELAKIINEENKIQEYYGDNMFIHGYFTRGTREAYEDDGLYSLYSTNDESNILVFMYDKKVDSDVGNQSEIIVKGKLGEFTNSKMPILIAEEIEIKKKEEPVYIVASIDELIESADKYLNKKITVGGIPAFNPYGEAMLYDNDISDCIWMSNIYDYQLGQSYWDELWVTGKLSLKNGRLMLTVESFDDGIR